MDSQKLVSIEEVFYIYQGQQTIIHIQPTVCFSMSPQLRIVFMHLNDWKKIGNWFSFSAYKYLHNIFDFTSWIAKPQIFAIYPFKEKICQPLYMFISFTIIVHIVEYVASHPNLWIGFSHNWVRYRLLLRKRKKKIPLDSRECNCPHNMWINIDLQVNILFC